MSIARRCKSDRRRGSVSQAPTDLLLLSGPAPALAPHVLEVSPKQDAY